MRIVEKIKRSGFPVFTSSGKVSQKYLKAHAAANRATLHKFGSRTAKAVNKINCPKNELLGSHTKRGKIKVSSRVPKRLRLAISFHERFEHKMMI